MKKSICDILNGMEPSLTPIERLLEIMALLRHPEKGCPWDRQQSFSTIVPYTLEEAYEVADAIERGAMDELREELGDLLFQVVFHAQMAREQGYFDFHDVVMAVQDKMVRRHPHVFGCAVVDSAEAQRRAWEEHKAEERAQTRPTTGLLDGVATTLPALMRAEKLQRRAARVGFDWPDTGGVLDKLREELKEVEDALDDSRGLREAVAEEVGDLLFTCVNLARHAGIDAESALRAANRKFERRFRAIEAALDGQGRRIEEVEAETLEALWDVVKRGEEEAGECGTSSV